MTQIPRTKSQETNGFEDVIPKAFGTKFGVQSRTYTVGNFFGFGAFDFVLIWFLYLGSC